jgi:hypothetical protein
LEPPQKPGRFKVTLDDLAKTGALHARLAEFERFVTQVERAAGCHLEWKRQ